MRSLRRLFGGGTKRRPRRISLGNGVFWEIEPTKDLPALLKAIPKAMPAEAILYLEGGSPPRKVKAFLKAHTAREGTRIARGTVWPWPVTFHLPATLENLEELARLVEGCPPPQIAVHLHVYQQDRVLLEWYDAFFWDPMYLPRCIPEDKVQAFCRELSLQYHACGSPNSR